MFPIATYIPACSPAVPHIGLPNALITYKPPITDTLICTTVPVYAVHRGSLDVAVWRGFDTGPASPHG